MKDRGRLALAAGAALGAAVGAWCICRDKKYPVRGELRFANKLAVPGWTLSAGTARLANRVLRRAGTPLPPLPRGVERQARTIPAGDGAPLALTVYRRQDAGRSAPCLVYFHGGGFCLADAGYIHRYAARYAAQAACTVVFVHYRTADRYPFPTPLEDCYTALSWVWEHGAQLGVDRTRLAVGGDSAGGALAAGCALRARDEAGPKLCFQLLIYPVTDCRMESPSMRACRDSPMWNGALNKRMWEIYLRGTVRPGCYASPMLAADFSALPPAYVETEEFDCLHDEGVAYARALERAGVAVQLEDVEGTFHGFDFFTGKEIARAMVKKRIGALRRAFWCPAAGAQDRSET